MSTLEASVHQELAGTVVVLEGELDIASISGLEEKLSEIERLRPAVLVLDLRGVSFLDSSGLRVILAADARGRAEGRRLALVRGSQIIHRVFEIALLDRRLDFVDDPAELGVRGAV